MAALIALTRAQSKVFLREPVSVIFGLVFPALLLVVIGSVFPGATEPNPGLGGKSLVEIYAPVLLVGALVPTATSGQAAGMLLYFPLLFFAGVYIPLEVKPQGIRTISGYTPAGAAVQALSDSWAGSVPATSSLLVMALYAVVAGVLAVWLFRWD